MKRVIVSIDGAGKIYHLRGLGRKMSVAALSDFTLDIFEGEILGLLGLNGAGKTTVMKLLTGLIFPTSGKVSVFGLDPREPRAKNSIGFLPELPYFPPHNTPYGALRYYGLLSGMSGSAIAAALPVVMEKVGLAPHAAKKISEFSKGMLQRLGLAQAVLHSPELLVLDEPVSGLDPLAIHDMRALISGMQAEGKTIFLSSHSISELEKICDRVIIMAGGHKTLSVERKNWETAPGALESLFVEAVRR
ncbi:MAG TPA: ABC transporter ATP-binding protein [Elusimicrobia bacterium]|nr:ABC transporter ATP-binding protein [Elusimicrobiota bacterium]HCE97507.1 ABC transporter ATP-binding protein [Elusimicrobiota bacterium]